MMRGALRRLQRCSISSTRQASSTAESALRAAAAQQQQQRRADAKRREASKRWRAGGRLLDEFRRLERDKAATREETRLAVMVALKRNALQRPAHVAAAARALAARGDAAGAAWLVRPAHLGGPFAALGSGAIRRAGRDRSRCYLGHPWSPVFAASFSHLLSLRFYKPVVHPERAQPLAPFPPPPVTHSVRPRY